MAEKRTLPRVERVVGDERKKALSAALAQIERQFGKGSIMRMGDKGMNEDIDVVSSFNLFSKKITPQYVQYTIVRSKIQERRNIKNPPQKRGI